VLAVAAQHDHPHVIVGRGPVEGGVEVVEQLQRLGVRAMRPVQRDDRDLVRGLVKDLVFICHIYFAPFRFPGVGMGVDPQASRVPTPDKPAS